MPLTSLASGRPSDWSGNRLVFVSGSDRAYTLFACADDTALVSEAYETNNCTAAPAPLTVGLPDLLELELLGSRPQRPEWHIPDLRAHEEQQRRWCSGIHFAILPVAGHGEEAPATSC